MVLGAPILVRLMREYNMTEASIKRAIGEFANKGDVVERNTVVDGKVVTVVRTVKRNATDDQSLVVEWKFDFSRLSETELLEMAARQATIDAQAAYRGSKDKADAWARRTFEYPLERERTTKTAFEKVTSAVAGGKLTDAEKAELLKLLQG